MSSTAPPSPRNLLSVLVVDDDALLAEVLAIQLGQLDCRVTTATSGPEALAALADGDVDVLLTDWQMPEMDGMEVVRRARDARPAEGYLHVVMMTARGDEATMRSALEAGVDDFLEKPIEPIQLEIAVASARRNRLLHRRLRRRNSLLAITHRRTRDALEKVRSDLEAATSLHERLLPASGRSGRLELSRIYRPAAELGGDSIGATRLPDGSMLFFVIDVRGHGVPAALESFHIHHRLKQLRPDTPERLGEALSVLNEEIAERDDDSYATIACGLLMPDARVGWLACAGHPPPILVDADGARLLEGGRSMPVGWFAGTPYRAERFAFRPGARLAVYSDGITESTGDDGDEYGVERLLALFERNQPAPLQDLVEGLEHGLLSRRPAMLLEDDISLLAIEHVNPELSHD